MGSALTWKTAHHPPGVLRISFAGRGGIGSEGNDDGIQMSAAVQKALADHNPAALLIDLRSFDYEFGDWIGSAPLKAAKALGVGRVCVVASGETMAALESLWVHGLDQVVPLFGESDEALTYFSGQQGEPRE